MGRRRAILLARKKMVQRPNRRGGVVGLPTIRVRFLHLTEEAVRPSA